MTIQNRYRPSHINMQTMLNERNMRFIAHLFAFLLFGRSRVETGFLKAEASRGGVRLDKQQALLFFSLSFILASQLVSHNYAVSLCARHDSRFPGVCHSRLAAR